MKKIIRLLYLVFLIVIIFIIYNNKSDKINLVSIGDSLTLGINSYNQEVYSYTDYLNEYLKNKNKINSYKKYAYRGLTCDELNYLLDTNNDLKRDLRESDVVTINIGASDFLNSINTNELNDLYKHKEISIIIINKIDLLIKKIKKYVTKKIIFIGYYNPSNKNKDFYKYIDSLYINLLNKYNIEYISLLDIDMNKYLEYKKSNYPNNIFYKDVSNLLINKILY